MDTKSGHQIFFTAKFILNLHWLFGFDEAGHRNTQVSKDTTDFQRESLPLRVILHFFLRHVIVIYVVYVWTRIKHLHLDQSIAEFNPFSMVSITLADILYPSEKACISRQVFFVFFKVSDLLHKVSFHKQQLRYFHNQYKSHNPNLKLFHLIGCWNEIWC